MSILTTIKNNVEYTIGSVKTIGLIETAKMNYGFLYRRSKVLGVFAVAFDLSLIVAGVVVILAAFGVV